MTHDTCTNLFPTYHLYNLITHLCVIYRQEEFGFALYYRQDLEEGWSIFHLQAKVNVRMDVWKIKLLPLLNVNHRTSVSSDDSQWTDRGRKQKRGSEEKRRERLSSAGKFNFGKAIRVRVSRLQFTTHERITPLLWILRIRRAPPYRVANRNQKPYQPSGPARTRLFAITKPGCLVYFRAFIRRRIF